VRGIIVAVVLAALSFAAVAEDDIPPLYTQIALKHQVPPKLFFALILNESRSTTDNRVGRKVLPWPWTVNHRGKPYFFQSRLQAFNFIKGLVASGDESFDVGLGQLNWYWHKQKFNSDLWSALDPVSNLHVSAKFFRQQYDRPECGAWERAVGCYHRPGQRRQDKDIAKKYSERVVRLWAKI
tara:strand:+ start:6895 stop:7440 length:546 start_codon:yes stop_codon:yes gene_type:complete